MSDKKIIAVVGATGAQGGGLARAILDDPNGSFALRALTRNPDSENASALARRGAEVVRADLDDPASLREAFRGAYGAFCVTNFWEHFSPQKEIDQAANMAEAARQEGLRHVVWSTLEDTRKWVPLEDDRMPTLQEKYKVPHFDAKAEADSEFTSRGVPTTFLLASFYWENFIYFGAGPQRGEDGVLAITMPMGDEKLAGIASEDIGRCALGVFKRPDEYIGATVGVAGDKNTGSELAAALGAALGEEVRYNAPPADVYRSFGFPGADELGNMFQFYRDFSDDVLALRSVSESRKLNPQLQDSETWLQANASKIPIDQGAE
jgi:uncharacterized protein YbjT (DUF2867 family)